MSDNQQIPPIPATSSLADPYHALQGQVDALQKIVIGQHKVWFKDISTLISLTALGLSITGAVISDLHTRSQDTQGMRQDLRSVLQRLDAIPREEVDFSVKYQGDPHSLTQINQMLSQEYALLARESADLGRRLPFRYISSSEFTAIALSQQANYDYKAAEEFLLLAQESATSFNDELTATRALANLAFIKGNSKQGRNGYQAALAIFDKYRDYDHLTVASTNIWTQLYWAESERAYATLESARPHVHDARVLLSSLPPSPNTLQLGVQIEDTSSRIEMLPQAGPTSGPTLTPDIPIIEVPHSHVIRPPH